MNNYDQMLIELGEKSHGGIGSGWPVEIRLLMLTLFNALIFIMIKYLSNWAGPELGSIIQSAINGLMTRNNPIQSSSQGTTQSNSNTSDDQSGTGIPNPPQNQQGGFDLGNLIANIGTMFTQGMSNNNNGNQQRARRRPRYDE